VFLDEFHNVVDEKIVISAEQASRFAKEVAGDFNPIHDPDARRFCVPGDLLFALTLSKYGLSQNMSVSFSGMVGKDKPLILPEKDDGVLEIKDETGKVYTHVEHSGDVSHDERLIESLIRKYVAFSGQNFPYILVPLLEKHQVMFNPKRPLVIYESMAFHLDTLSIKNPELSLVQSTLDAKEKRGDAHFLFEISDGGKVVGKGEKKLIVSGLQPYNSEVMGEVVTNFNQLKDAYLASV
jgi:hypothetical protein